MDEGKLYVLMPYGWRCFFCGYEILILEVERRVYESGRGVASCVKCGHQAWFKFFKDGRQVGRVITQADVDFLLYEPDF